MDSRHRLPPTTPTDLELFGPVHRPQYRFRIRLFLRFLAHWPVDANVFLSQP
jgi:hypothetical protein